MPESAVWVARIVAEGSADPVASKTIFVLFRFRVHPNKDRTRHNVVQG